MKERPILFSGPMVRAILEGRKTQTRRIVKPQPPAECGYVINGAQSHALCRSEHDYGILVPPTPKSVDHRLPYPYGQPGDRLWVKETFKPFEAGHGCHYRQEVAHCVSGPWKPSIFMPRRFSRITLEITAVRVERLQDISEVDASAEGVDSTMPFKWRADEWQNRTPNVARYAALWESINGPGSWDANPWVWVIEFRRIQP